MKDRDPWCEQCVKYSLKIERSKDFILVLALNKGINQMANAYSVHWYGCVEER